MIFFCLKFRALSKVSPLFLFSVAFLYSSQANAGLCEKHFYVGREVATVKYPSYRTEAKKGTILACEEEGQKVTVQWSHETQNTPTDPIEPIPLTKETVNGETLWVGVSRLPPFFLGDEVITLKKTPEAPEKRINIRCISATPQMGVILKLYENRFDQGETKGWALLRRICDDGKECGGEVIRSLYNMTRIEPPQFEKKKAKVKKRRKAKGSQDEKVKPPADSLNSDFATPPPPYDPAPTNALPPYEPSAPAQQEEET